VECGAYIHELHRLYIGLQSDKFKNVHIADGEAHHPESLETICPFAPLDGWQDSR